MGNRIKNWGLYRMHALGYFVAGPLVFYLLQPVVEYFSGNRDAVAYTEAYVRGWDSIRIVLPEDIYNQSREEGAIHNKAVTDGRRTKRWIYTTSVKYYIPLYKKYFELIWVGGIDVFVGMYNRRYDAAVTQNYLMRPGIVLSVYVNRTQWKDKSYGTKEKPVPAFVHRIISGDDIEKRNAHALKMDSLYPKIDLPDCYLPPRVVQRLRNTPDSINFKFAEYYLRYLLPEDEFDRLFGDD